MADEQVKDDCKMGDADEAEASVSHGAAPLAHRKSPRPRRSDTTEADFQEAFLHLYADKPVDAITVGGLCERAGYNRGTFYLHYTDIYALLHAIEDEQLKGMAACVETALAALQGDARKLARLGALKDVIAYYERHRFAIEVLLGTRADPAFILRLKNALKPLWRRYVVDDDALGEHSEAEIDLILECTLTGMLFMVSQWLREPGDISKARIGHLVFDAAIRDVRERVAR